MKIKLYQIDAFIYDKVFSGNPAAVCLLEDQWLPDDVMQKIANENNLAETAFVINKDGKYSIRWFTPRTEVCLCGHATLAAAYVLLELARCGEKSIIFNSKSGGLSVTGEDGFISMNFPADVITRIDSDVMFRDCFDVRPTEIYKGRTDYLLIYDGEDQIKEIKLNHGALAKIDARGIIISAEGHDVDFVSRFFAPQIGIVEDPVTGSAHTTLIPYWSGRLHKDELTAVQLSERKGLLKCRDLKERVEISGRAVCYMTGMIEI
ncbi:MAG: PhzF family phenazine biosynthesis protein [Fibrobacteraceae bacterium]|nr:PhzF family phenazine biosynthesis protein [Fibrobacteraceae bacterium]